MDSKSENDAVFYVPDIENLVFSAIDSCAESGGSLDFWNCDIFSLQVKLPSGKFLTWALGTIPRLPDCFSQFVSASLQHSVTLEVVSFFIMNLYCACLFEGLNFAISIN